MKNVIVWAIALFLAMESLTGCSSKPFAEDKPMDKVLNFNDGTGNRLGMKDGKAVFERRIYLEQRLASLRGDIQDLREVNDRLVTESNSCRVRLQDSRIGGQGLVVTMDKVADASSNPDWTYVLTPADSVELVSLEELHTRMERFEKLKAVLADQRDSLTTKNSECEQRYKTALTTHGFAPETTEARGAWVDGSWVLVRPATFDLDEIARRSQK